MFFCPKKMYYLKSNVNNVFFGLKNTHIKTYYLISNVSNVAKNMIYKKESFLKSKKLESLLFPQQMQKYLTKLHGAQI